MAQVNTYIIRKRWINLIYNVSFQTVSISFVEAHLVGITRTVARFNLIGYSIEKTQVLKLSRSSGTLQLCKSDY